MVRLKRVCKPRKETGRISLCEGNMSSGEYKTSPSWIAIDKL